MDPECHALLCGQGKAVGQAGVIWSQAKQAGDQGFIRAMSLSGGGKAAVQADIRLHRDLAQKLLGRVADPGGTRCMAGRGADHNRPENVKQAHPMHILSCSAGQKSPASHFFSLLLYRFCPTCAIITLLMFEIAPLGQHGGWIPMKLVSVETPEKSVCKMTFSATAEELETASNAVYERTRASYTIKGFAKGEADRAQIEADRGEHTFWYDAINDLMDRDVPALYEAAMAEHGFKAVDEPSYDLVSVKKDEGFVATATTPLQPELNLTQTTGFHVECVTPAVTDKEIDTVLERRRNAAAELVPHKGPAVKGNIVHIDYEGLLDGKPFQGGSAQNQTLQLGSGRMIPGFEDGILGHKGGEEFEINVTFPARYHVKDLAGKPVVFKIKLIDVCVRQLPALNSDFAKKVGKVDTMEAFREQVRKQLHDGKHASALNRAKDQVLTQLASAAEGELPSVLVESTYQQEMQNIQQQLQMQRMSLDRYLSQIHQTRENFTANVHAAAEKNTRARMALLQVAQNEGLVPTDEEITKNLQERADRTKKTLEEVKANANIPAMQRSEAIRRAADWVIEHSTIEEK